MQEEQTDAPTKLQGPDVSKVYTETCINKLGCRQGDGLVPRFSACMASSGLGSEYPWARQRSKHVL